MDWLLVGHAAVTITLLGVVRATRRWPWLFVLLTWPGTLAHELLHYTAGWLLGARPVALSILPRRQPNGALILGQVHFARLRWWNKVPVGLAPVGLLPLAGWLFQRSMSQPLLSWPSLLLAFAVGQCLLATWPSPQDWRHIRYGATVVLLLAGLVMISLWWLSR